LTLKLVDAWKALEESEKIFNQINNWLNGITMVFIPNDEKLIEVLKVHRFKLLWHFIKNERIKDPNNGVLDKIRDIMVWK